MAITEKQRHQLHTRFEQVLGPEEATVVMELLTSVSWADVATKRDLDALETRIDARLAHLQGDMNNRFAAVDSRFAGVDTRIAELRETMERSMREQQSGLFVRFLAAQAAFTAVVLTAIGLAG